MPSSSASKRELDAVLPENIISELALWKHLLFDSNMAEKRHDDHGQDRNRPRIPPPHPQAPHPAPPQLPPETYTYLIQALLSLQGSAHPHNYPPTPPHASHPAYNYPWPPDIPPPIPSAPIAGPSSFYPTNSPIPLPPPFAPQSASPSQLAPLAAFPTSASTAQDPEGTEDAISVDEDKRRRNTAASGEGASPTTDRRSDGTPKARFRVKKKLKTLNLERTVADLTGRTEELEREANDLRRENTWLKEIVLLKGRNLATPNLESQASASGNRDDEDERNDGTQAASEHESRVKRGEKGKDKEKYN